MKAKRDRREYMKAYYQRNKERYAEYNRQHYKEKYVPVAELSEDDLLIRRAIRRIYYANQREKRQAYMREYMRKKKEAAQANTSEYK